MEDWKRPREEVQRSMLAGCRRRQLVSLLLEPGELLADSSKAGLCVRSPPVSGLDHATAASRLALDRINLAGRISWR